MNGEIAVKVENLSKVYKLYNKSTDRIKEVLNPFKKSYHKNFRALDGISFEIRKGETVGIIGKNGSGKSTLLKLLTGVLTPTSGDIKVNGRVSSLLELGAGFNPELTGIENIFLNGALFGYSKEEMNQRLDSILSFAEIGDFVYQPVKMYSSGMFARLAFSVAINVNPEVLIIDEALAVGDSLFQRKCFRKFEEYRTDNKTILFVTHDLQTVKQYCSFVYLLNDGAIIDQGEPNRVVNNYYKIVFGDPNDKAIKVDQQKGEQRFGNGNGEILRLDLINDKGEVVEAIESCEDSIIRVRVIAKKKITCPIIGFTIKTINGIEVFHTNTYDEGLILPPQDCGSELVVEFRQKLTLNSGEFFISSGFSEIVDSKIIPLDRRLDFKKVVVYPNNHTTGIVNLHSQIAYKHNNNL